ncbi:169_t:CDS:1 [Ambispora gerdemannii]|uniref:169_t:CDS:1 n=1 Tax=Ambispora gerdemannii TaxID=144530 RepID=A0A9N9BH79_9GLOM|nr:169_t:CDS:1 [Ambispora gerdemannii]
MKQISNEYEQEEASINWLASDINCQSEVESTRIISTSETEDTDYCYDIDNTSIKVEEFVQCVIVDIINNKVQRYTNSVSRPIKQLQGTWELDFVLADEKIKKYGSKALQLLGVCSSHFNFDQDRIYKRDTKNKMPIKKV